MIRRFMLGLVLVFVGAATSYGQGNTQITRTRVQLDDGAVTAAVLCVEQAGAGTPEGAVLGAPCDTFKRTDGPPHEYTKETGGTRTSPTNTGWVAQSTGSGVNTAGTPLDNQVAVFTDADTIEGSNLFVFDGTNVGIGTASPEASLDVRGHVDITLIAVENDVHGLELIVDAAGFGDVKGLDINYDSGAIVTGEDEGVILVNINELDATGGRVIALEVLSTDGGADAIYAVKAGAVVAPILQDSGSFGNPDTGTNNTAGPADVAAMIDGSTGTNTTIFVADDDYVLIGALAAFTEIEFVIETPAGNPGIQPTFGYSTAGAHQFTTFSPIDGTNGFRNVGVVAWDAVDLTGHTTNDDTGTFDIKITRTHSSQGSVSLFYAKTAATVVYSWDKDGVVTVSSVGIGDATPTHTLDVTGTFGFSDTLLISGTAPTVSSCGTSPSILAENGTAAFRVTVGTATPTSCQVDLSPTATTGWNCYVTNMTARLANVADQKVFQISDTTTAAVLENQTISTGAAAAFVDGDVLAVSCFAF